MHLFGIYKCLKTAGKEMCQERGNASSAMLTHKLRECLATE